MKKTLFFIIILLSINSFSEQMFAFDSKILPSELLRENSINGYIGADFLSYNGLFMISKSTEKHTLTGGFLYKNYGGIIYSSLIDSLEESPYMNPPLEIDTFSAYSILIFASYGILHEKYDLSFLLSFSYIDLIDIYSVNSGVDISFSYRNFFDYSVNLMDIIPVLNYSDGMEYSYSPYSITSLSKDIFEYKSFNIKWGLNIYIYYKNYSDQQFIHKNYSLSRSMDFEISSGKILLSGEFFSERFKASAEYQINERVKIIGAYSGNSLLSSVKFGLSYKY